jgi:hypothetical protein
MADHVVSGHRTPAALARRLNGVQAVEDFFLVGWIEERLHGGEPSPRSMTFIRKL